MEYNKQIFAMLHENEGQEADNDLTSKEMRRLSRRELIELIYEMKMREEQYRASLKEAERLLNEREIRLQKAGSIAEAALALNDIFSVAQRAADDYLQSIREMNPVGESTGEEEEKKIFTIENTDDR